MNYLIHHKTTYTYFEPVSLCHNIIRLLPRTTEKQLCRNSKIKISPDPDTIVEYDDFFGNKVLYFSIEKEHKQLIVDVSSEIEKGDIPEIEINSATKASIAQVKKELLELKPVPYDVQQYVFETPMTAWNDEIKKYALQSFSQERPVLEAAKELTHRIFTDFEFKPGFTTIATPLSEVMQQRKGVCQDFAHLAIACLRSVGLAARYVSGYIETISPAETEKLVGVDASHAWFSVYISGLGWVDFDPTNNLMPSNQHITIGWGRDYADIAPFKGVILSSGQHELKVAVDVKREN